MRATACLPACLHAAHRGLELLWRLARRKSTFATYSGHLLPAFYFIAATTRDASLSRKALRFGRERARYWKEQWHLKPRRTNAVTVVDQIGASYAAARLGIPHRWIRRAIEDAAARYSPAELLGFDLRSGTIPRDVPDDCECGAHNERGRRRCRRCRGRLLGRERTLLKASMAWALKRGEADTVAEIVDSLAGCGVADTDPRMIQGRKFILDQQREDGGWGDEHDDHGRCHSVWTCIDGLRDDKWQPAPQPAQSSVKKSARIGARDQRLERDRPGAIRKNLGCGIWSLGSFLTPRRDQYPAASSIPPKPGSSSGTSGGRQ